MKGVHTLAMGPAMLYHQTKISVVHASIGDCIPSQPPGQLAGLTDCRSAATATSCSRLPHSGHFAVSIQIMSVYDGHSQSQCSSKLKQLCVALKVVLLAKATKQRLLSLSTGDSWSVYMDTSSSSFWRRLKQSPTRGSWGRGAMAPFRHRTLAS